LRDNRRRSSFLWRLLTRLKLFHHPQPGEFILASRNRLPGRDKRGNQGTGGKDAYVEFIDPRKQTVGYEICDDFIGIKILFARPVTEIGIADTKAVAAA
jgi:hypothetical protein